MHSISLSYRSPLL